MGDHIQGQSFVYIHWMQYPDWGELYDLQEDPFESRNLMGEPGMEAVLEGLKEELRASALHAMGLSG